LSAFGHSGKTPRGGQFFDITIPHQPVLPEITSNSSMKARIRKSRDRGAKQIFLGERVRNIGRARKTRALVQYVNNHLVRSEVHGKVDFLSGRFLVPIVKALITPSRTLIPMR